MVSEQTIRKWAELYNTEIGRADRIEDSVRYFMALRDVATFIDEKEYYLVYMIAPDMWGDKELYVVSFYIKPEYRNTNIFLKMQRQIESVAKENKIRYTIQGSHIDDKYFKLLSGIGYKVATMRKENK